MVIFYRKWFIQSNKRDQICYDILLILSPILAHPLVHDEFPTHFVPYFSNGSNFIVMLNV